MIRARARLWRVHVSPGVVVAALGRHELADCRQRFGVSRGDSDLAAAWKVAVRVGDETPAASHDIGAGHSVGVDEFRSREVARLEGVLNELEMGTDLGYRQRVVVFHLERDA